MISEIPEDFRVRVSWLRMKAEEYRADHGRDAMPPGELVTCWEDEFDRLQPVGRVDLCPQAETSGLPPREPEPYRMPDTPLYTGRASLPAQLTFDGRAQFSLDL